ncbi:CRS2-associated factor 1, mitochondrial-like [Chenopodium quinoa]|uniref:CRS2-associated factor 1, mitochondrial-like n=1 Tax=Chenopodium quinoa TaxID=63459 RepID=UPI000B789EBF|nr:CRS2-associated factor 1, mitochondrial-like [Chenopodium quinoa]
MFMFVIPRQNLRHRLSLSSLLRHLSTTTTSSKLHTKYSFTPPPSLSRQNPNSNPNSPSQNPNSSTKIRKKPLYRPPSTLDTGGKPLRSNLPFDFRYSYTESNPSVRPIGLRGPKHSPFGPGRLKREWTGVCAPVKSPRVLSVDGEVEDDDSKLEERRRLTKEKLLGKPLTDAEKKILVDSCQRGKVKKQVNLGRDGLTHNMLNDIHNHWKDAEAVRIKCMGVPTIDMENVITQLEDKTFGKIIHRQSGLLVLYRGRNYKFKKRPLIPLMLWKPQEPVYPKLIKTTVEGLSIEETKKLRKRGLAVPALTKLSRNKYYGGLVVMVRDAFLVQELVRIDCTGLDKSDHKKIAVKLRDLVPCIPVILEKEQIVVWRGPNHEPTENRPILTARGSVENSIDNMIWDS